MGRLKNLMVVLWCATIWFGLPALVWPSTAAASSSPSLPGNPAGLQAQWLLAATANLPIPTAQVQAHFDTTFLAQVSPAQLNQVLAGANDVKLVSITVNQPDALVVIVSSGGTAGQLKVSLSVDAQGLISGLFLTPVIPVAPTTWSGVDTALESVAPHVRLLVADVTGGSCRTLHAIDPAVASPLGSAFKLYVLDAVARDVAAGKVSWRQRLTVTAQLKSLPSGDLQNDPDGTRASALDVTDKMISISDNTAANMLIHLVGRSAVESALHSTGMAKPSLDEPFLTTRELFILKLDQWPTLANRYLKADEAGRRALLAGTVDQAPLPSLASAAAWTSPRDIDSLEWFASADDICNVYLSLGALAQRPGLAPMAAALEINDGGLGLNRAEWHSIWFKGGSEPGVLTLTYRATTRSGKSYVVVALAQNPSAPIDETAAAPVMLSAIKGAFSLAADR